jgi:hypothetical protein
MILDALLALGIVMSSATQLSVPGLGLTIGESSLLLWIILSLGRMLAGGQIVHTPALARLGGFWVALALLLCVGTVVGYLTKVLYAPVVLHDTMSYFLLALVTCLAAAKPDAPQSLRRCAWFVIAIANATFAIQVAQGWGLFHQSNISPWYFDRFQGWSQNPNQLALYCAAFGPIALHLATTSNKTLGKIAGFAGLILPFYVGRMTKSDTYLYTSILTCLIFLGLRLRTWLSAGGGKSMLSRQIAVLLLLGSVPLALATVPLGTGEFGNAVTFAKSLTKDKGDAATENTATLRVQLWNEAIEEGYQSASLGLGPGPHLENPPGTYRRFLTRPFEAHSTILDLYTQGGAMTVLLLIWIAGSAVAFAWRAKLDALVALIASLAVFSLPHLIIRHPIVWFSITLCLAAGSARVQPAARAR